MSAIILPLGRGSPTHLMWYPEFDTVPEKLFRIKLDQSIKDILGDLSKDPSDDEQAPARLNRKSSKNTEASKPPQRRRPPPENGRRENSTQLSQMEEGLDLPSSSNSDLSLNGNAQDSGSQGDVQAFLPRNPLKVSFPSWSAALPPFSSSPNTVHEKGYAEPPAKSL